MKKKLFKLVTYFYFINYIIFLPACVNTSKAVYFNNIQDSEIVTQVESLEPVIHKNDLLSISVSSLNPEATKIFNSPNVSEGEFANLTGRGIGLSGYLVNQDGYIQFPILGNIKAAGLSKKSLKENITKSLVDKRLLIDPIVNIRYLNFKVTVLGEVASPTVVNVPNEKISLLEALGLAGDLTIYAKRHNVMVIREEEGKKVVKRINLNSTDLFTSPYYYLKSNDIVYVEPDKTKVATASQARQWLPLIFSGLTVIVVAIDRLVR
jgi:polysaccharide biosynthesis/export protein